MASPEGVRTVRVHRILSHAEHGNLIVAAFFEHGASGAGKPAPRGHFAVLDAARGAIVARPEPADLHAASVRAMAFCGCAGRVFLVTVADDKDIRLWALPAEGQGDKATLLGSKTLVKRGNAAVIVPAKDEGWFEAGHEADPDGSPVVLVADKFGDLYRCVGPQPSFFPY